MFNLQASIICDAQAVGQSESLFALMSTHFNGLNREQFDADLAEKDAVIRVHERTTGRLVGFTSLLHREIDFQNQKFLVFYSGDTIVDPEYWGSPELPRAWLRLVFDLASQTPDRQPYWLLISSGFRTYRFLSVLCREFAPRFDAPTSETTRQLMHRFAAEQYGDQYVPDRGIVRLRHPTPLRAELAHISPGRKQDPHVAHFLQLNPGWIDGDELVCLAEAVPQNLTKAGRRLVDAR